MLKGKVGAQLKQGWWQFFVLLLLLVVIVFALSFWLHQFQRYRSVQRHGWKFVLRHILQAQLSDLGRASLAFSPDGQLLAVTENNGAVKVWNVFDGKLVATLHPFPHRFVPRYLQPRGLCLSFSPDGQWLAVGYSDDVVRVFDLVNGKIKMQLGKPCPSGLGSGVQTVAFSPNGKFLTMGINGKVMIWRVEDGKRVKTLQTPYSSIAFSPNGKWFVTGGDKGVNLWQIDGWKLLRHLPKSGFIKLAFSKDDRRLMIVGWGWAEVWDIAIGSRLSFIQPRSRFPRDASFSPDGELVAITDTRWIDWIGWLQRRISNLHLPKILNPFAKLEPHRSGITIWRLSDGKQFAQLMRGIKWLPIGVSFSPDGQFVAIGYELGSVAIWELKRIQ